MSLVPHLLVTFATAGALAAQCGNVVFPGNIPPSPWTPAGSPYCVLGDVTIPTALTVAAGTVIEVHGAFAVTLAGTVTVSGSAAQPVLLRPGGTATTWRGLIVQRAGSVLDHVEVFRATDSGIRIEGTGITVRHAKVHRCSGNNGGGVRVEPPAGTIGVIALEDCWISDNAATVSGGGLYANVQNGADLEVRDTTVVRNRNNPNNANGNYVGGGVHLLGSGAVVFDRVTVRANRCYARSNCDPCSAQGSGGGIHAQVANLTIRRSALTENVVETSAGFWGGNRSSRALGGALYATSTVTALALESTVVACNRASAIEASGLFSRGGGIYSVSPLAALAHVTLFHNTCGSGPSGLNLYVESGAFTGQHCVVFSRSGAPNGIAGNATFTFSDIEGGFSGTGNITVPPGFVDQNGCDCGALAIAAGSQLVDMGDPQAPGDGCVPPGHGTARADIGHLGGPGNCGFVRSAVPFALYLAPPRVLLGTPAPTIATILDGGAPGSPAAVVLTGYNGTPIAPLWLGLFGLTCPTRLASFDLPLPTLPIGLTSLEFLGATLTNGALVLSAPRSLPIQ
jgi:hypothetical protein